MSTAAIIFGFTVASLVGWAFGFLSGVYAHTLDMLADRREREGGN